MRDQRPTGLLCLALTFCVVGAMDIAIAESKAPELQKSTIGSDSSWHFDFATTRGAAIPALVKTTGPRTDNQELRFYLFGVIEGANRVGFPLRWDINEGVLFVTYTLPPVHHPATPSLQRYPLNALVAGPDDGRPALDLQKFKNLDEYVNYTNYGSCVPIADIFTGLYFSWEAKNRIKKPVKEVHYEIRVIDATTVELFMSADGELSRWVFDGKDWKNLKHYDFRMEGEFLVFDEGRSVVFQRDGKWAIMRNIDEATPVVRDLTDRVEDEPLILVEDRVSRYQHFIDRDRLLDADGREVSRLRRGPARERIREAIDTVITRRRP